MIGQLPARTSMRAYYHLENVNDSSGNGQNLTNDMVSFSGARKFNATADFGTSGNKSLAYSSNILSGLQIANITYSFWLKLNDAATSSTDARLFVMASRSDSNVNGCSNLMFYNISTGTVTFIARTTLSSVNAEVTRVMTADLLWHHIAVVKSGTTGLALYWDGVLVDSDTGTGTDVAPAITTAHHFVIGNNRNAKTNQAFSAFDEFIIEERAWSASEVRKYYSQARGFLAA